MQVEFTRIGIVQRKSECTIAHLCFIYSSPLGEDRAAAPGITVPFFELGSPLSSSASSSSALPGLFLFFSWGAFFSRDASVSFSRVKCSLRLGMVLNVLRHLQHSNSSFKRGSCSLFRNDTSWV